MNIETYGVGERMRLLPELLSDIDALHILLLPVPTTRDGLFVSGTEIMLCDVIDGVREGSIVFGYRIPDWCKERIIGRSGVFCDLAEKENFLEANAKITAAGTLCYIMNTEKRQPADMKFEIVGYGRIGRELVRILLFLGAGVSVHTRRRETMLELIESGICATRGIYDGEFEGSDADILINTAPCDFSGAFRLGKIPNGVRVIELASGNNFGGVLGVEPLMSVPEKYFPESAAMAYACLVREYLGGRK